MRQDNTRHVMVQDCTKQEILLSLISFTKFTCHSQLTTSFWGMEQRPEGQLRNLNFDSSKHAEKKEKITGMLYTTNSFAS